MRVLWAIGEGVMLAVKYRVGSRIQVRRTLRDIGQEMEGSLPELGHCEHLVRPIPMQEERLEKHREGRVRDECDCDSHDCQLPNRITMRKLGRARRTLIAKV